MIFEYGKLETNYLKEKDKKLGEAIEKIGLIKREVNPDIYSSLVSSIISQQISSKAAVSIWNKFENKCKNITPEKIIKLSNDELRELGISYKKANYIKGLTKKIISSELDLNSLSLKSDEEIIEELTKLNGVGVWTAEMIMIFSMGRKNILSYNDFGIKKGLMNLYHHRKIDKKLFNKYKRRYSPYATIASFYLWEIARSK